MYTLDTNIIIYYLKEEKSAVDLMEKIFTENVAIYISTLTELELLSFSNLTPKEIEHIENFFKIVSIIPVDSRIARIGASLRRMYKIKTIDSVIAATALFTNSILITRNLKDFKKIKNLKLLGF